jgi:hypothetical protein
MTDDPGHLSWDDLQRDLEATQAVQQRLDAFFSAVPDAHRRWLASHPGRVRVRGPAPTDLGYRLIKRCTQETQVRYATLLAQEASLPGHLDYGFLICPACTIVESVLDQWVVTPASGIVASLIAALRFEEADRGSANSLERWAAKPVPTTLGLESILLLALRRGWEHEVAPVKEFLKARFTVEYHQLLLSKELGRCLERLRTRYRNVSCHSTPVTFDASA